MHFINIPMPVDNIPENWNYHSNKSILNELFIKIIYFSELENAAIRTSVLYIDENETV